MYGNEKNPVILSQPVPSGKQYPDLNNASAPNSMAVFNAANPGIPPGLEYLSTLDTVFIKQKVELLEVLCGCETKNKYEIKSSRGELMFKAKEDTDCCTRNCCGPIRPFDLNITDLQERTLIHIYRPLRCGNFCCPCCGLQELDVYSPPGHLVGSIEQKWSIFPKFDIKDASGNIILKLTGPFCTFSCKCGSVEFQVLSADGETEVGKISKQWSGFLREGFTDADFFGVNFPADLSIQVKATLLGACFLIDFMYFEHNQ